MEEKEDDEEREEEREEQASPGLQETEEEREEQASPGPQETKEEEREEQASPGLQETEEEEQWFCGRGLTTEFCEVPHSSSRPRLFGVMGTDLERTTPVDHIHNSGYTGSTVFLVVQV